MATQETTPKERSRAALCEAIAAAGIPFDGASGFPQAMRLDFGVAATDQQKIDAQAIVDAWAWSESPQAVRDAAGIRGDAKSRIEGDAVEAHYLRAMLRTIARLTGETPAEVRAVFLAAIDTD